MPTASAGNPVQRLSPVNHAPHTAYTQYTRFLKHPSLILTRNRQQNKLISLLFRHTWRKIAYSFSRKIVQNFTASGMIRTASNAACRTRTTGAHADDDNSCCDKMTPFRLENAHSRTLPRQCPRFIMSKKSVNVKNIFARRGTVCASPLFVVHSALVTFGLSLKSFPRIRIFFLFEILSCSITFIFISLKFSYVGHDGVSATAATTEPWPLPESNK